MVIGHAHILNFFKTAREQGMLGHAYGFIGPGSVGKRTIAKVIAAEFLKVPLEKLESHPDYIYLERTEDEKTGKLKKNITVSEARILRDRLQHTSWQTGGLRVIVVNEAELLNNEASSALLKILEEPPLGSIFFLMAENENALLTTIRSRLQPFYFSLVKSTVIAAGLKTMGINDEAADLSARRSLGRPGLALRLLEEERAAQHDAQLEKFQKLVSAPFYEKIQLVEEYFGDKEDGERGREEWRRILETWTNWFRDLLLRRTGSAEFAGEPGLAVKANYSNEELLNIMDTLSETKRLLSQNAHPRLAIETALLKF